MTGPADPIVDQDEALSRRLKALACTAPLHDLDARKGRLDWADAEIYQMAEIALQAIDQVTIAMDFDRGADHDQVVSRLLPFIAAQAPERATGEHEQVARWVLDNLINVGTLDRGFRQVYGTFGADGVYRRRSFDFKLLAELVSADGDVYLRSSDEAINVLVGALDTDVESAQIAAEVKLENLIRRGRLSDARLAAEQARYRTVQYAEMLRRKLEATRRDVRSVDWEQEVPDLVEDALTHIQDRFRAENAILKNITATRDDAEDADRKRRAAELVSIVRDCIRRHTQLEARLIEAGDTFRAEQDRQQFSGVARRSTVDLFGQLLMPCLDLPLADAARPTGAFFNANAGVRVPVAPGLAATVQMLLTPSHEREHLIGEVPDLDLLPPVEAYRFTDEHWRRSEELLGAGVDTVPRRLSGLLSEARQVDGDLPALIALRVLYAFSPEVSSARMQGDDRLLVAVDTGQALDDAEFGGADLLVTQARLASEPTGADEPAGSGEEEVA